MEPAASGDLSSIVQDFSNLSLDNLPKRLPPSERDLLEALEFFEENFKQFRRCFYDSVPEVKDFTRCPHLGEFARRLKKLSQADWRQYREVITVERIRTFLDENRDLYMVDDRVVNNFNIQLHLGHLADGIMNDLPASVEADLLVSMIRRMPQNNKVYRCLKLALDKMPLDVKTYRALALTSKDFAAYAKKSLADRVSNYTIGLNDLGLVTTKKMINFLSGLGTLLKNVVLRPLTDVTEEEFAEIVRLQPNVEWLMPDVMQRSRYQIVEGIKGIDGWCYSTVGTLNASHAKLRPDSNRDEDWTQDETLEYAFTRAYKVPDFEFFLYSNQPLSTRAKVLISQCETLKTFRFHHCVKSSRRSDQLQTESGLTKEHIKELGSFTLTHRRRKK